MSKSVLIGDNSIRRAASDFIKVRLVYPSARKLHDGFMTFGMQPYAFITVHWTIEPASPQTIKRPIASQRQVMIRSMEDMIGWMVVGWILLVVLLMACGVGFYRQWKGEP